MGIEPLILKKISSLSEDQKYAVLGYIEHLLVEPMQIKPFPPTRLEDGIGCTGYQGERKSLKDMQDGIANEGLPT